MSGPAIGKLHVQSVIMRKEANGCSVTNVMLTVQAVTYEEVMPIQSCGLMRHYGKLELKLCDGTTVAYDHTTCLDTT